MNTKTAVSAVIFLILLSVFSCTKKSVLTPLTATPINTAISTQTPVPVGTALPITGPDTYETDDTYLTAKTIAVNGTIQHHGFDSSCDDDYVMFNALSGISYTIETLNIGASVDTKLTLYSTNGTTSLAIDDDSGTGYASRIIWTATASGIFYVKAEELFCNYGSTTVYDLRITSP